MAARRGRRVRGDGRADRRPTSRRSAKATFTVEAVDGAREGHRPRRGGVRRRARCRRRRGRALDPLRPDLLRRARHRAGAAAPATPARSSSRAPGELVEVLVAQARAHVDTVCVGRTHGVHAEPTTFGIKLAGFAIEAHRNPSASRRRSPTAAVGAISGAVGTYSATSPEFEAKVLERAGSQAPSRSRPRSSRATATPRCSRRSRWPAPASNAWPPRSATCSARRCARPRSRFAPASRRARARCPTSATRSRPSGSPASRACCAATPRPAWRTSPCGTSATSRTRAPSGSILPDATILLDYMQSLAIRVTRGPRHQRRPDGGQHRADPRRAVLPARAARAGRAAACRATTPTASSRSRPSRRGTAARRCASCSTTSSCGPRPRRDLRPARLHASRRTRSSGASTRSSPPRSRERTRAGAGRHRRRRLLADPRRAAVHDGPRRPRGRRDQGRVAGRRRHARAGGRRSPPTARARTSSRSTATSARSPWTSTTTTIARWPSSSAAAPTWSSRTSARARWSASASAMTSSPPTTGASSRARSPGSAPARAAELPGYDLLIQGVGGLMSVTGPAGGPPSKVGVAVVDVLAGLFAAVGILAALRERERSGHGQRVEVSLMQALLAGLVNQSSGVLGAGFVPSAMGNRHPSIAPYETFAASDGDLVLAVGNDRQFAALCAELGIGELSADARFATNAARVTNRDVLAAALAPRLRLGTRAAWAQRLEHDRRPLRAGQRPARGVRVRATARPRHGRRDGRRPSPGRRPDRPRRHAGALPHAAARARRRRSGDPRLAGVTVSVSGHGCGPLRSLASPQ